MVVHASDLERRTPQFLTDPEQVFVETDSQSLVFQECLVFFCGEDDVQIDLRLGGTDKSENSEEISVPLALPVLSLSGARRKGFPKRRAHFLSVQIVLVVRPFSKHWHSPVASGILQDGMVVGCVGGLFAEWAAWSIEVGGSAEFHELVRRRRQRCRDRKTQTGRALMPLTFLRPELSRDAVLR